MTAIRRDETRVLWIVNGGRIEVQYVDGRGQVIDRPLQDGEREPHIVREVGELLRRG